VQPEVVQPGTHNLLCGAWKGDRMCCAQAGACSHLQAFVIHECQALCTPCGYALNLSGVLSKAHAHIANVRHPTDLGIQILQMNA